MHVMDHMDIRTVRIWSECMVYTLMGIRTVRVMSECMGILIQSDFHTVGFDNTKTRIRNRNDFIFQNISKTKVSMFHTITSILKEINSAICLQFVYKAEHISDLFTKWEIILPLLCKCTLFGK